MDSMAGSNYRQQMKMNSRAEQVTAVHPGTVQAQFRENIHHPQHISRLKCLDLAEFYRNCFLRSLVHGLIFPSTKIQLEDPDSILKKSYIWPLLKVNLEPIFQVSS
jgi:hypothetical protein